MGPCRATRETVKQTLAREKGPAEGAPAPGGSCPRSVLWVTRLTAALVVIGAAWFLPSSFATAASALRAAGTPPPGTHPPRDPFKPLVGQANPAAPGTSSAPAPTAPPQAGPAQPSTPPRRQRTGGHTTSAEPTPARPALPVTPKGSRHLVGRGETLWQIAVASSIPGSSVAALAARANAIYAANRAVIGRDPSRLVAGTVVILPMSAYAG